MGFSNILKLLAVLAVTRSEIATSSGLEESHAGPQGKDVYVTYLYGNFVLGVRVLGLSLRKTGTTRDMVVLCASTVSERTKTILVKDGWIVKSIGEIKNPYKCNSGPDKIAKLQLWTLTDYRRIVYIDADAIVVDNIDELFHCGAFCAVFRHSDYFNTGIIVLRPSLDIYRDMFSKLGTLPTYDNYDQGFLNSYYKSLLNASIFEPSNPTSQEDIMRLPAVYNGDVGIYYALNSKWFIAIKVIHYTLGPVKPWIWWSYLLFDLNWKWTQLRDQLMYYEDVDPGITSSPVNMVPFIGLVCMLISLFLFQPYYQLLFNQNRILDFLTRWAPVDSVFANLFPTAILLFSVYISFYLVPLQLHPISALVLFFMWILFLLIPPYVLYCGFLHAMGEKHGQQKITMFFTPKLESLIAIIIFVLFYTSIVSVSLFVSYFVSRLTKFFSMLLLCSVGSHIIGRRILNTWFGFKKLTGSR